VSRRLVAAGLAGVAVGAALAWVVARSQAPGGEAAPAADAPAASADAEPRTPTRELFGVAIPPAAHGPRPASLRGTAVAGSVSVDAAGHFVPTVGVRHLFDHFLSAADEEPLDVIRGRILLHLHDALREPAASEAAAFLDDYLALRAAQAEAEAAGEVPELLERRLPWLQELRRQHLGAVAARALFGDEEQLVRLEIERRAALPAELREQVDSLRAAGAGESEDPRAGGEHAAWSARLEDYRAERDALRDDPELGEAERERAVEELRREQFEGRELERVRALDAGS